MSNNVSIITVIIGNNQQFQEYSDFKSAMVSLQSLCHGPAEVWGLFWNTILVFLDFDFKFELFYHELQGLAIMNCRVVGRFRGRPWLECCVE